MFDVYLIKNRDTGRGQRLLGKYIIHDGIVHVVSDHNGLLKGLDGKPSGEPRVARQIHALHDSIYMHVEKKDTSQRPITEEDHAWEDEVFEKPEDLSGNFVLHGQAGEQSAVDIDHDGNVSQNGQPLPPEQVDQIVKLIQEGKLALMHAQLQKAEGEAELFKPSMKSVFESLQGLVDNGDMAQDEYDGFHREFYHDDQCEGILNNRSHRDTLSDPWAAQGQVHLVFDLDHLGDINDAHGYAGGDQCVVAFGQALGQAVTALAEKGDLKAHRVNGDEFHVVADGPEMAHSFLATLRQKLETTPAIGGTHPVHTSVGVGLSFDHAHRALADAKEKFQGSTPLNVVSFLPGGTQPSTPDTTTAPTM